MRTYDYRILIFDAGMWRILVNVANSGGTGTKKQIRKHVDAFSRNMPQSFQLGAGTVNANGEITGILYDESNN